MARILVCGTLAYDDIGTFDTPLSPGTRNVKLHRLDRVFGGCAMNIAYNLAGLGHHPVPFVYAGDDYSGDYARHVAASGISEAGIFRIPGTPSARGIVLTGSDGAQFTAFYPGPSGLERWQRDLDGVLSEGSFDAAILAPDLPEKMTGCARRLAGVPLTVWCPGQYAELLERADIEPVLDGSDLLVVNRHEWQALCSRIAAAEIHARDVQVIVTHGPDAVELLPGGATVAVPTLAPDRIVDPTGCGDAFVAALTGALLSAAPPNAAVAAGARLAGCCIAWRGAQSHPVRPTT
jgi:adenosine kinase